MKINLYVANHGKRDGIEEYIRIVEDVFRKRGHSVKVAEVLDADALNLIIDEFTNFVCNEEIAHFRRDNPQARLVFVLTEFIGQRLLVRSFNLFDGFLEPAVLALMNVYLRLRRKDFIPPGFRDWAVGIIHAPLACCYVLKHLWLNLFSRSRKPFARRLHRQVYLLMRYLGLERMIAHADAAILSHDAIAAGLAHMPTCPRVLGTLHPEMNWEIIEASLFRGKKPFCEVTGSVTTYRQEWIDAINRRIITLGMHNRLGLCQPIAFGNDNAPLPARGAFSLHPPQTQGWNYSSPTRIFRALQYDHNLPVLTKVFNQHPIEKLGLEFRGDDSIVDMYRYFKDPQALFAWLRPRVEEYMAVASRHNDAIVSALEALGQGLPTHGDAP